MKLKNKKVTLKKGLIKIIRNEHGIPEITADSLLNLYYGLGWVHASDRQLQIMLTRILLQGRASEKITDSAELIEIDLYMKKMNFFSDIEEEIDRLFPEVRDLVQSYTDGINKYLKNNRPVFELKLYGYKPEPWRIQDTVLLVKAFSFLGLPYTQGNIEKLLIQMIQNDVSEKKIKELFPNLKEKIDYDLIKKIKPAPPLIPKAVKWLNILPKFNAGNNWVISGNRTDSGNPILCGDPQLETNNVPSLLMEVVMRLPEETFLGASLPGMPGIFIGRNKNVSWSPTSSFSNMLDYRIEHCRDGKYKRNNRWIPFEVRKETITTKNGKKISELVYENEHGILEGDPHREGYYLIAGSAAKECGAGDINGLCNLMLSKSVRQAMKHLKLLDAASFNFVIADTRGNIGYQMTGRLFNRPKHVSGLLALPGWENSHNSRGFVNKSRLPSQYNPKEGFIVPAIHEINHPGLAPVINCTMASCRADCIRQLFTKRNKMDIDYMKEIQYDLYSLQAEKYMEIIRPLIPDTKKGKILKEWDYIYTDDSPGAYIFENVYLSILETIFGKNGMGSDIIAFLIKDMSIFNAYFGNFDHIVFGEESSWFNGENRNVHLMIAIYKSINKKMHPYGKTRRMYFRHILFGGKLPSFFGFDRGQISLPGNRATILQGQICNSGGRKTTFSPSYRFITDMGTEEIHSNLPGGPSDRRFSKWYFTDFKNWLAGNYKVLK